MLVQDFYANREIFITGGTGFLGKSLIEKLLRDFLNVKSVFLLLRGKKSFSAEQRLEELKQSPIFDRIRNECPEVLNKLHAIDGDSSKLGLDIKPQDMELIKDVSIIFHMAANVKFDNPFASSILINTRGTYELVKIAETLKNLVAFVHCSTAYCNALENVIEEKIYKMPVDWRKTIKMAEKFDETTLNALFLKYTGFYPNAYSFTKNLSEQLIQEYATKLPMFITRPSIVMSSLREPVKAYIDNMNGPIGSLIASGIGICPILFGNKNLSLDTVPVDLVSKFSLLAAYKRGLQTLNKEVKPNEVEVIHCSSGEIFKATNAQAMIYYGRALNRNPMENCLWCFDMPWITSSFNEFFLYMIFISIPIAVLMDNILRLMGRKPFLLKIQRRILYTTEITKHYSAKQYRITSDKIWELENLIPVSEKDELPLQYEVDNFNLYDYFDNFNCGVKRYLFNQPMQASKAAIKRRRILKIANKVIKFILCFIFLNYFWSMVIKKLF